MIIPITENDVKLKPTVHRAVFVISWIAFSSITILFNKYLLSNLEFHYPAILTCWHLLFSTVVTQILAKASNLLDGRKHVRMTGRTYLRAIVPIGLLYSASLVCSNQTYLYLSVAFIQMLKASAPAAVLITSWLFRVETPKLTVFFNVMVIVFGVALASYGEVKFVWLGFIYQAGGILSEAIRLIMIQVLLSTEGQRMDPLVSLYYYAPVCTVMNLLVAAATELSSFQLADVWRAGIWVLLLNAAVAFMLNVASVFLIGKTSGLVMTLCGVLKNILLIIASVIIWGTVITGLQVLGYSVAIAGLVYYGLGYEGIQAFCAQSQVWARKCWETEGQSAAWRPLMSRAAFVGTLLMVLILLLGVVGNSRSPIYKTMPAQSLLGYDLQVGK